MKCTFATSARTLQLRSIKVAHKTRLHGWGSEIASCSARNVARDVYFILRRLRKLRSTSHSTPVYAQSSCISRLSTKDTLHKPLQEGHACTAQVTPCKPLRASYWSKLPYVSRKPLRISTSTRDTRRKSLCASCTLCSLRKVRCVSCFAQVDLRICVSRFAQATLCKRV